MTKELSDKVKLMFEAENLLGKAAQALLEATETTEKDRYAARSYDSALPKGIEILLVLAKHARKLRTTLIAELRCFVDYDF